VAIAPITVVQSISTSFCKRPIVQISVAAAFKPHGGYVTGPQGVREVARSNEKGAVLKSASESFLKGLADRTFLSLWSIPNTFYAPGKELTDLIVPFGDDIIVISDKASRFAFDKPLKIAWQRWYKATVVEGLRQLKTAVQRIERTPGTVFADGRARVPILHDLGSVAAKRFHLVAIARPDTDPHAVPAVWPGLTYSSDTLPEPFAIGPLEIAGQVVHVFDGPTIDLLFEHLDTAPDFLAYLTGRAWRLAQADQHRFAEKDLLAAALIGWEEEPPGLPSVPPLETIVPGLWDMYAASETPVRRREMDRPSEVIDRLIAIHHGEFEAGRALYGVPSFAQHEFAMRLLAAESRFARRIIAHELHDIVQEEDQSTYWVSTVASPTMPTLRYVWLIHPDAPEGISNEVADAAIRTLLMDYILAIQGRFEQTLVLGIALPNGRGNNTSIIMAAHDKTNWTEHDFEEARKLRDGGVFNAPEANQRLHFR